ncbi:hypothetical protein [Paraburkholderia kirstenboschensis]|uniref:Cytochrome C oxidase subunit I n=1 Tax=Paraburkholderia kirstenboschensis TaxID=1245436 RepID=A0ABZ0EDK4_9BURK|nr:hypothetical protein [Paraburkholderia kirstenboschensis]WOD15015.1 hypothetical protein RW095_16905 [Paraburkholderia kirstenboschensis]
MMLAAELYQKSPAEPDPATARRAAGNTSARLNPYPRRGGALMMLFGLLGAAAAWGLQTEIGETLAAQACFPHRTALPAPQWPWLVPALNVMSIVALLVGIAGVWVAWRSWRIARGARPDSAASESDTAAGRTRFLAMAGLILSLLFLVGVVTAGLAVLLVSPCSAWR